MSRLAAYSADIILQQFCNKNSSKLLFFSAKYAIISIWRKCKKPGKCVNFWILWAYHTRSCYILCWTGWTDQHFSIYGQSDLISTPTYCILYMWSFMLFTWMLHHHPLLFIPSEHPQRQSALLLLYGLPPQYLSGYPYTANQANS